MKFKKRQPNVMLPLSREFLLQMNNVYDTNTVHKNTPQVHA